MTHVEIDIMTLSVDFHDAVFKNDTSGLGKTATMLIERELRWYWEGAEEDYPNFLELDFEVVSDKPRMADCHVTGFHVECIDVSVMVVLSENESN